jgi:hypothetical protein
MVSFASLLLCNAINSKHTRKMTVLSLQTQMRNQSLKENFTRLNQMTGHDLQNDKIDKDLMDILYLNKVKIIILAACL